MKYICSCSFGKDSLATLILARLHGEPVDEVVYCEVMYDDKISGEVPEHRDFIYNTAIPQLEAWGYKVQVVRSDVTYLDSFHHLLVRGKNQGMKRGFPWFGGCCIQRDCKLRPMKAYWKSQGDDVCQYVGIAIDEPKRLERLKERKQVSLLAKYGYTEEDAKKLCIEYGLLSPIYSFARRNGCWFCPNAGKEELRHLYFNHRDLAEQLMALEKVENVQEAGGKTFNRDGTATQAFEPFMYEAAQLSLFDLYSTT